MTVLAHRAAWRKLPVLALTFMLFATCAYPTPTVAGVQAQLAKRLGAEGFSAVTVSAVDTDRFTGTALHADGTVWTVTASVKRGQLRYESSSTVSKQTTDASGNVTTSQTGSVVAGTIPYDG
ncbi:MAG: hypothetical protein FJ293_03935 [Planctomycetes bacterium]|nr:hypothetical protein [Planctomycetota bacterium]